MPGASSGAQASSPLEKSSQWLLPAGEGHSHSLQSSCPSEQGNFTTRETLVKVKAKPRNTSPLKGRLTHKVIQYFAATTLRPQQQGFTYRQWSQQCPWGVLRKTHGDQKQQCRCHEPLSPTAIASNKHNPHPSHISINPHVRNLLIGFWFCFLYLYEVMGVN